MKIRGLLFHAAALCVAVLVFLFLVGEGLKACGFVSIGRHCEVCGIPFILIGLTCIFVDFRSALSKASPRQ